MTYAEKCSCGATIEVAARFSETITRMIDDWRLNHTCPKRSPHTCGIDYMQTVTMTWLQKNAALDYAGRRLNR